MGGRHSRADHPQGAQDVPAFVEQANGETLAAVAVPQWAAATRALTIRTNRALNAVDRRMLKPDGNRDRNAQSGGVPSGVSRADSQISAGRTAR